MPELLAGTTISALDTPPVVEVSDGTNFSSISNTAFIPSSPEVATQFIAPTFGRVIVAVSAGLSNDDTNNTLVSFEIRENNSVGTQIFTPNDDNAVRNRNARIITGSSVTLIQGLIPGSIYFVRVLYRVTAGATGFVSFRGISVSPAS